MDPGKFEKKVIKLHKQLEAGKLNAASAGAAKLSGEDLSHAQRVALMSFQVKMIRMAKKEADARTIISNQKSLVGKMAPYLAEAIRMTRDGQYDDCIPRLKGALSREELADETPLLSHLFPSARNIVHAHLLYSLDERACMKALNRPTGYKGGEDRKHVMRFWSLPEAYYYMDVKTCPKCGSGIKGARQGEPTGAQLWSLKCPECDHEWRRVFAVVPPQPGQPE
jgi:hypothetical protein